MELETGKEYFYFYNFYILSFKVIDIEGKKSSPFSFTGTIEWTRNPALIGPCMRTDLENFRFPCPLYSSLPECVLDVSEIFWHCSTMVEEDTRRELEKIRKKLNQYSLQGYR